MPECLPPTVRFGREVTGDLTVAESREWLVTNGIGGYASGTVAGSNARGYHGMLVAAVRPPTDRRLLLARLDDTITVDGRDIALATERWASGAVAPAGHVGIERFELRGTIPTWRYRCAGVVVDKAVWMEHGRNTTYVAYTLVESPRDVGLRVSAIVDHRPFHDTGSVTRPSGVEALVDGVAVRWEGPGEADAPQLTVRVDAPARVELADDLVVGFRLPRETERGLRDTDDHVHAATIAITLAPGATAVVAASTEADAPLGTGAIDRRRERDRFLLERFRAARAERIGSSRAPAPPWIEQLVLAADQFVVARPTADRPDGTSVIAGYHWFGDWGRDTMISLPGLTLTTGRPEVAAPILATFAAAVSEGMLPNRFPDRGDVAEYNTIDATLWYVHAVRAHREATGDLTLLTELFPVLADIVDAHVRGTRYGIAVDPDDGLLRWDADGVQPTWMDARVGDHVVTPRRGKPVEVNALWYHALRTMASFARDLGLDPTIYDDLAARAGAGFARFWNADAGCLFDVIDGPDGDDATIRPNQIVAVALPDTALCAERARAVVDTVAARLLTSHGLASLAASDPAYRGSYGGDQASRDGAYHQGTVWAWLIGSFVDATLRVHGDPQAARRVLEPFADHLHAAGVGSISEIFDGDAPHGPHGCIAQAWSVAEVLRAWAAIEVADAAESTAAADTSTTGGRSS